MGIKQDEDLFYQKIKNRADAQLYIRAIELFY
jgi:hypothetical protein